ncbi:hypothetical protein LINPERHAP1_LOCUS18007 [Linum perenne]
MPMSTASFIFPSLSITTVVASTLLLFLSGLTLSDDTCPYPCYPPPTGPGSPAAVTNPPPTSQSSSYPPPPPAGNNIPSAYYIPPPPPSGNNNYDINNNPPPNAILPYFPYYYRKPPRKPDDDIGSTPPPLGLLWPASGSIFFAILFLDSDPLLKDRTPVHSFTSHQFVVVLFLFLLLSLALILSDSTSFLPLDLLFALPSAFFFLTYFVSSSSASIQISNL